MFKVRLGANGLGKSRGVRMICAIVHERVWALFIYAKQAQADVPARDLLAAIRAVAEEG